jgi:hypothetical protein
LFPPLFFQTPSAFAPFFSPIGFFWCSHAPNLHHLYFSLPTSVVRLRTVLRLIRRLRVSQ